MQNDQIYERKGEIKNTKKNKTTLKRMCELGNYCFKYYTGKVWERLIIIAGMLGRRSVPSP